MRNLRNKLIDEIFTGASDRSGGERDKFLDDQCGDDAELKREVQLLLRNSVATGDELANALNEARGRLR